jgi:hypothetical protein
MRLVTGTTGLGNDVGEFLNLLLGTLEGTQLKTEQEKIT